MFHLQRRERILRAHPDVAKLGGHEWRSKYICTIIVALQTLLSIVVPRLSWWAYLFVAYIIGATLTQALFLAVHEMTHNLFFRTPLANRGFALVANWPVVVPFAAAFREYHLDHHRSQGVEGVDTDLPSSLERRLVRGRLRKILWLGLHILAYALRPVLQRPQPITRWHTANIMSQCAFCGALFWYAGGVSPIVYLSLCALLAGGLHPCAGHFLSEHYVFDNRVKETTSYYGQLNALTWNVGYHNEHHDFPNVAWSRLPLLRASAPEFYSEKHSCRSWIGIQYQYIVRDDVGPWSRVLRHSQESLPRAAHRKHHDPCDEYIDAVMRTSAHDYNTGGNTVRPQGGTPRRVRFRE